MFHILFRVAPLGIALSALIVVTLSLALPTRTVVVYVDSSTNTDAVQGALRPVAPGSELMEIGQNAGAAMNMDQCGMVKRTAPGDAWI